MIKKRWIIVGILAFIAIGIIFSDKQHLYYLYELHIAPILQSDQTNLIHIDED